jgi:PmbA protein
MSGDLLDLAQRIVAQARRSDELEAYVTHEREFSVKAFAGEVEHVSSAEPRGAGVRVVSDGRAGFAYTTDVTDAGIADVVSKARDNSRFATHDEAVGLAPPWTTDPPDVDGMVDESQTSVAPDDKVQFALDLEQATRTFDKRVRQVEEAAYSDSLTEVAFATSSGISGSYRRTDAWCYAIAIATDRDDTQVGFEFDVGRGISTLDFEDVARRAAERALGILGASKIASARMPVVFEPYTAAQFLSVLGSALTGEAVAKGRSLFAGKLGQEVAADGLTLVDDGRIEGAPGSAPWDAEGVPTGRTAVIEAGVLSSYLYDVTSARRDGTKSTGNAARSGFKSPPGPQPSNLAFESTGDARSEVLSSAGRALLVQDFHGVHSGANAVSGDFSVGATGRLLDGGELGAPVKEVTIAAPMLEILSGIVAVADDLRWIPFGGSYGGATTLVSEMTVAGR